jgi:putative tryptophan/tyrosine transport system substrate-binding protein
LQSFLVFFFLLLSFAYTYAESDRKTVLIVQTTGIRPYSQTVEGFKSICRHETRKLVLSEAEGLNIFREIRSIKPDLILAVGAEALLRLKAIKDIPIVYAMVSNPDSLPVSGTNITGVSMNIAPEKQLSLIGEVFPDFRRVGLLYNAGKSGQFAKHAIYAARETPLKVVSREIQYAKEVPFQINSLKDKIDVFWMIPDENVFSPESTEYLMLFSFENKIPVLTFTEKYLAMGAAISLSIDANDIGRQAGEMAEKVLAGTKVSGIKASYARKAVVSVNPVVARKLGRSIDKEIFTGGRQD